MMNDDTFSIQKNKVLNVNSSSHRRPKVRLSGAARKRLLRLLAANYSIDEARAIASKPWNQINIPIPPPLSTQARVCNKEVGNTEPPGMPPKTLTKRQRSEEEPHNMPNKVARLDEAQAGPSRIKPTFRETVGASRVGIRNIEPMSEDQMRLLHRQINLAIARADKGTGPKFIGFSMKPGWILVTCENQYSQDWLESRIQTFKPWPEAILSFVPESELPKPTVCTIFVPVSEAETLEEALQLLRAQNEGLNTEHWKVLTSREEKGGIVATFFIDDPSAEALKALDCRATIGFKKIVFRVKSGSDGAAASTSREPASVSGQQEVVLVPSQVAPTAYYISEFITPAEEKYILSNIYASPKPKWTQLSNRRLQNWGGIPHNKGMIAEEIPQWLQTYLEKIDELNLMNGNKPNHVLVNEYMPNQGILPHLDGSLFYPTITTISVASHTVLKFSEQISNEDPLLKPIFSILLEPRSLLILQDKLFSHYLHSIDEVEEDFLDDSIVNLNMCSDKYARNSRISRDTRISLTIRHVPKTTTFKINIGKKR